MKKTIDLLKKEREKQKISISEIASITKISLSTLKAIEECDLPNLPPKPYLRGFVRSYAICLDLDPAKILDKFDLEMGSTKHKPKKRTDSSTKKNFKSLLKEIYGNVVKYKFKGTTFKVFVIVITLVLVGVFIVLKQMFDKYSKEASTPAVSPTITNVLDTEDDLDGTEDMLYDEVSNNENSDTVREEANVVTTTTTTTVANNVRTVEVTALGDLDISYAIDGDNFINITLQSGQTISIAGDEIELTTSNAGLTAISIDGENIGNPAGNMGEQFNFNVGG